MFGRNWTEKVVALFSDSRIAWFKDDQDEVEDTLMPPPPTELYPSVIKPLDPQLTATLETLCQGKQSECKTSSTQTDYFACSLLHPPAAGRHQVPRP